MVLAILLCPLLYLQNNLRLNFKSPLSTFADMVSHLLIKGLNKEKDDDDFSIETLIKDSIKVIEYLAKKFPSKSIVVVGHSMGGAVAAKTVKTIFETPDKYTLAKSVVKAVTVIDVAEGTAMSALSSMDAVIAAKPKDFITEEEAIIWNVQSNTVRLTESARVSTPPTLFHIKESSGRERYQWKTDLTKTRPYWEGWYKGLSKDFINEKVPKQLVLAGPDRMDTELTIGQMEGKFKLDIVANVGHLIQEDDPKALSEVIEGFILGFKINEDASK